MDTAYTLFSRQASLVLVGQWFQRQGWWTTISRQVHIHQKQRRYTPQDKLLDTFITMLAGGRGVVESNLRVRPDVAVQRAFGRTGCAEQATLSRTLSACQTENVAELRAAVEQILREAGQCARHDYTQHWQVLDVDLTGLGGGRQGEGVTRGYFAQRGRRRGRQLGRVLASRYAESVVEQVYEGRRQLEKSFQPLVLQAEIALNLTEFQRHHTVLRVDGGAGSTPNIRWALQRGYGLIVKLHSAARARKLAQSVTTWCPDPTVADRELGWVTTPVDYGRPTQQLALRHPKTDKHGQPTWHYHVLVCAVPEPVLRELCPTPRPPQTVDLAVLVSQVYDLRSGALETQIRSDKQGLGLAKRTKRSLAAQEILVLLTQLAHNVSLWARNHLATVAPRFAHFGVQRLVRDVFQIDGQVHLTSERILSVELCSQHPYAHAVQHAFAQPPE